MSNHSDDAVPEREESAHPVRRATQSDDWEKRLDAARARRAEIRRARGLEEEAPREEQARPAPDESTPSHPDEAAEAPTPPPRSEWPERTGGSDHRGDVASSGERSPPVPPHAKPEAPRLQRGRPVPPQDRHAPLRAEPEARAAMRRRGGARGVWTATIFALGLGLGGAGMFWLGRSDTTIAPAGDAPAAMSRAPSLSDVQGSDDLAALPSPTDPATGLTAPETPVTEAASPTPPPETGLGDLTLQDPPRPPSRDAALRESALLRLATTASAAPPVRIHASAIEEIDETLQALGFVIERQPSVFPIEETTVFYFSEEDAGVARDLALVIDGEAVDLTGLEPELGSPEERGLELYLAD